MIEIREGETARHTIKNPGQAIFIVLIILLVIFGIAFGVGFLSKSI